MEKNNNWGSSAKRTSGNNSSERVNFNQGMGDHHIVLHVDNLLKPENLSSIRGPNVPEFEGKNDDPDEDEPLIQILECRICQEEDHLVNLENPCLCNGSLKFAHRKCVQRWCNEKGNTICEICQKPFQPDFTAPTPTPTPPRSQDTAVDISENWTISSNARDMHDPRLLAMAGTGRNFLEADYDDYTIRDTNGSAFCRSAALILVALLLLRHALSITGVDGDADIATFVALFLLRAIGFLLPCYIMAWAVNILQRRRQREDETIGAATDVAIVLQSDQNGGLQFTIGLASAMNPPHGE